MSADALPAADTRRALAVTARGLTKSFGAKRVIDALDLHVPAGHFLAIVGRSGCGKSTLLRLLAALERPDSGTVRFDDRPATPASIRMMFQEPRLLPWADVRGNVAVGLDGGRGDADRRGAADAALAAVGLADLATRWPAKLSGGQMQRVALARALVSRPRVMAFDEPLGALDALTRLEMQALIERVCAEQGFTAVLVTHDVSEAVALADRVVMLDGGRVALDIAVPLPRPRRRGSAEAAALEEFILSQLLGSPPSPVHPQAHMSHSVMGDAR